MPRYTTGSTTQGIFSVDITPVSADGAALGTIALPWSDLRLASGAVIDVGNGEITVTFAADTATLAGGVLTLPDGLAASPSWRVTSEDSGMFLNSAGTMGLVLTGGVYHLFTSTYHRFNNSNMYIDINADTFWGRDAAASWQAGIDSATPIAQTIKGPDARDGTDTNTVGGRINWRTGLSTGTGVPALGSLQGGAASVTSGTAAHVVVDRFIPNAFKVLTDGSAIAVVNATIANGSSVGGLITYTIEVWDGTDNQVETGQAVYSSKNKAGVVTGTITEINSQQNLDAGTLATTWAISAANPAVISINADSSLVPSTGYPRITFGIQNLGQQAIAIQ